MTVNEQNLRICPVEKSTTAGTGPLKEGWCFALLGSAPSQQVFISYNSVSDMDFCKIYCTRSGYNKMRGS